MRRAYGWVVKEERKTRLSRGGLSCCLDVYLFGSVISLSETSIMSLSLVSNAYIEETSSKIRSKPVPWEVSIQLG